MEIKITHHQARKIVDDMPTIKEASYLSMSNDKKDEFHLVLATAFLESNYIGRQEMIDISIDSLYSRYSHADMYERGYIEPSLSTEEEEAMFEAGDYDSLPSNCWDFLHDNAIDHACEEQSIKHVLNDEDNDCKDIYYRESDAWDEEVFEHILQNSLDRFKSQSLAMDLHASLSVKAEPTRKMKI